MTRAEAVARVARGAALLDKKRAGWAARINIGVFDLDDECMCILGQLEGSYWMAIGRWFSVAGERPGCILSLHPDENSIAEAHGFNAHTQRDEVGEETRDAAMSLLQDAWIEAIADRIAPVEWPLSRGEAQPAATVVADDQAG